MKLSVTKLFAQFSLALLAGLLLGCGSEKVPGILVATPAEFVAATTQLQPGDTVVLASGTWADVQMVFEGVGTADQPITLTVQKPGETIISGRSNLRLAGEYLVVSGLVFKDGYTPTDSVISFRKNSQQLANHSRVTQTVIDGFNNPERFEPDYWVAMYGKHNRFDHNHLEGKRNKGVTMAVRLDSEASRENFHRIDHNYFGPRPILGSNGGETLRIGTSHYSRSNSNTLVESNYFDRCDGELEIISNKSGSNTFRGNVFFQSRGTLTLRHGHDNLLENNVFFGNDADHTGGLRVINKRQTIRNNYMEGLKGYRFGGALVVMNGVPNGPINRYDPVEDALIANNTLVESDHIQLGAGSDSERSAPPVRSQFTNNLIVNGDGRDTFTLYDNMSGIAFAGNLLNEVVNPTVARGFSSQLIELERADNGLLYPVDEAFAGVGVSRDLAVISKSDTGVAWYPKATAPVSFGSGTILQVSPADGALAASVAAAAPGDTLQLAAGHYQVASIIELDKPLTVRADGDAHIEFERQTLFEIAEGGSIELIGLNISGASSPDYVGNSVIRTSRYSMLRNYNVRVENCRVTDLQVNRGFNFMSVAKSTMADNIEILNSHFSDLSGDLLKLNAETDNYGIYNAEYTTISNSSFANIQGSLVNYYRGGTDESTFGPHFALLDSQLSNVGRGAKNASAASVYLHGVQVANISGNRFAGSAPIKVEHTVGEPITRITNNHFADTAAPEVVELFYVSDSHKAIIDGNRLDKESN